MIIKLRQAICSNFFLTFVNPRLKLVYVGAHEHESKCDYKRQYYEIECIAEPASWSSGNAFVSESGGLKFKSRAGQIGLSVANGSPPLQHFFEWTCVAHAQ